MAKPTLNPTSAQQKAVLKLLEDGSRKDEKTDKKQSVLESHGYTLGRTIGSGSFATVKVAESSRHNCKVAIKIVSKFQLHGEYLKKFLSREIEVVKGLKHPNLIRFLQAIETTHRVYIVMEYAQHGSLLDTIRRDRYIDEFRSRRWFRQLVEAVNYCHQRGIVHRDVKCENLLMDHNSNVKLSDFGFARSYMKPRDGITPLSETFCGSYAYASLEILKCIPYQPQLSDVWSMGVVLFAMVYGRLPFDDTNYALLLKVPRYNEENVKVICEKFIAFINERLKTCYYIYVQQVQNGVNFPNTPKVSQACQSLITRILVPQPLRLSINSIKNDGWVAAFLVTVQTSTTDSLLGYRPRPLLARKDNDAD